MFKFNRKRFFDAYRADFGPLSQDLVDSLEGLLAAFEQDPRFAETETGLRQVSYCLATFKWETAHTLRPIHEFGTAARFNKLYGPQTKVGKALGNKHPGDGAKFHGRGYVQLTGRNNYARAGRLTGVDLISNPDRSLEPALAYQIAIQGMIDGWFTGKKLSHFFKDDLQPDWVNARKIINGLDKAETIAGFGRRFNEILHVAKE